MVVCPYLYLELIKNKIERQCNNMLALDINLGSTSRFSSLVLLVHKTDKTWRFCELNMKTLRDKFPIPLVDELKGVRFITNLDVCNGSHQVRMHLDDVAKMTFQTHLGHFKFLVMLFGLPNVSSTF